MAIKVAINGFGRIGRAVARIISSRKDVELVAINVKIGKTFYFVWISPSIGYGKDLKKAGDTASTKRKGKV